MRWELRRVADLTAGEQTALRTLSLAVYPPEVSAEWPGRAIEWAAHQWAVNGWDAEGAAGCYVGVVLREARWNDRAVRVGGGAEVTLAGLFVDYVDHLEHHLRKMLGRWEGGAT